MSNLCVIKGCPGSLRRKKRGEKIFFFKALEDQLSEWNRVIPAGNKEIKIHDRVCSRHFKDDDLIKDWNFVINDKSVTMPRGRWTLKIGAVPEKFDNYDDDFIRERRSRKSRPTSLVDPSGSSSSDEELEERRRKRPKRHEKLAKAPIMETKTYERVEKPPKTGTKTCSTSTKKTSKETSVKSAGQEANWDKSCDEFVNQLKTIFSPTPAKGLNATPAKRGRGRPRKYPLKPAIKRSRGRPPKDKESVWVSKAPASHENSSRPARGKCFSSANSEVETDNSVTIEQFVASGSEERGFESSDGSQNASELYAELSKRSRRRPLERKEPSIVSFTDLEQSAVSGCEGVVEILNDPDSSSEVLPEFSIPSQITIKTEKCDGEDEHCDSASLKQIDDCSVTSGSENSAPQRGPDNKRNYQGVVVKREMCDCEVSYLECCEPVKNSEKISELPASPITCSETDIAEESHVDCEGMGAIPHTANEPSTCNNSSSDVNFEPIKASYPDFIKQGNQTTPSERNEMPEPLTDPTDQASQSGESLIRTLTPGIGFEEITTPRKAAKTDQQGVKESTDVEMDFQGFSSGEDENLVLKRKVFENSKAMAEKSAATYLTKLRANNKTAVKHGESSLITSHKGGLEQKSSVEIAINQLKDLGTSSRDRSKKLATHIKQMLVTNSAPKIKDSLVQGRKSNSSGASKERLALRVSPRPRPDEVLKCGRLSDEVTVTKALNPSQRLDKVAPVSSLGRELDKVVPSSTHSQFADKSRLESPHSSNSEPILNKVTASSNCDLLKDKTMTNTSNHCQNGNKVTTFSKNHTFTNKVPISSNRDLFKDVGTSTTESGSRIDKLRSTYLEPPPDRLAHQLNGSSLDRILNSTKGIPLLDSVSSTSISDLNADKTSLLLKNFKSDGILALECVVYKEQVRQLQKELFRHKQLLIESEHNISLLQRRLELQAELPCAKCINLNRGFIGKETLI